MFVFLNAYLLAGGMEKWEIGLCDGGFWLVSVLLQPWLGPQLDRRGRILFLRVGAVLLALSALGYAYAPTQIGYILPLRLLQGTGFALYLTSAWAWISDHAPPEKMHTIFGIFGLSSLGGSIAGPVAAQFLRGSHPPHDDLEVFLGAGCLLGLACLVLLTLRDAPRDGASEDSCNSDSLWKLARRSSMRGPLVGSLSFGLAVGSLFAFAAAYLEELGIESVSQLFVVLTVVAGFGRAFCGKLSGRFGASNLIAPCLLSLALGSAGLGVLQWVHDPSEWMILLPGAVAGIGYGLVYPLLNGLAYERLQAHERGRGVSLVAGSIDSGNAFGAAVAGALAHQWGEGQMFLVMGAAVAVTAILSRVVDRRDL